MMSNNSNNNYLLDVASSKTLLSSPSSSYYNNDNNNTVVNNNIMLNMTKLNNPRRRAMVAVASSSSSPSPSSSSSKRLSKYSNVSLQSFAKQSSIFITADYEQQKKKNEHNHMNNKNNRSGMAQNAIRDTTVTPKMNNIRSRLSSSSNQRNSGSTHGGLYRANNINSSHGGCGSNDGGMEYDAVSTKKKNPSCADKIYHHHRRPNYFNYHAGVAVPLKAPCYEDVFYPQHQQALSSSSQKQLQHQHQYKNNRHHQKRRFVVADNISSRNSYIHAADAPPLKAPCYEDVFYSKHQQALSSSSQKQLQDQHQYKNNRHHQKRRFVVADNISSRNSYIHAADAPPLKAPCYEDVFYSKQPLVENQQHQYKKHRRIVVTTKNNTKLNDFNEITLPQPKVHCYEHVIYPHPSKSLQQQQQQQPQQQHQKKKNSLSTSSSLSYSTTSSSSSLSSSATGSSIFTRGTGTNNTPVTATASHLLSSSTRPVTTIENNSSFGGIQVSDLVSKSERESRDDDTDFVFSNNKNTWWDDNATKTTNDDVDTNNGFVDCLDNVSSFRNIPQRRRGQGRRQRRSRTERAFCGIYDSAGRCYCQYCTKWEDIVTEYTENEEYLDPMAGFEDFNGNNNNNNRTNNWEGHHSDNVVDDDELRQGFESMDILDKSNWMDDETKAAVVGCVEDSLFDNFQSPFNPRFLPFAENQQDDR